jgi:hypothetical protein
LLGNIFKLPNIGSCLSTTTSTTRKRTKKKITHNKNQSGIRKIRKTTTTKRKFVFEKWYFD